MAAVLMTGRDGRTALLAFTGTRAWTAGTVLRGGEARPVPVPARQAAQAALQDQAAALLVDVAGPVLFVVEGEDLESLAAGHRLVRPRRRFAGPGHRPGGLSRSCCRSSLAATRSLDGGFCHTGPDTLYPCA